MNKEKKFKKKAQTGVQYFIENAFRVGFLMLALTIFFLLISFYITTKTDSKRLQAEAFASRVMYSEAIMYHDPNTFRTYPGIVDAARFNTVNLDSYISYSFKRNIAAKMTILSKDGKTAIKETYYNKNTYENLNVYIASGIEGKESATYFQKMLPVTYKNEDGSFVYATLVLEIVVPNS